MIKLLKGEAKKVLGIDLDWSPPEVLPSRKGHRICSKAKTLPKRMLEQMIEKKSLFEKRGFFLERTMRGWVLSAALVPPKEIAAEYVNGEKLKRLLWEPTVKIDETGLLPYQVAGVKRLVNALQKHRRACELSDGGVGKTYMGAAAARHLGHPVMVVCPPVVKTEWANVLLSFGVEIIAIESWEAVRGNFRKDYYIYQEGWKLPRNSTLIIDELHYGKADNSLSGHLVKAASRADCYVLGITASLATGPHEMDGAGQLFGLHSGGESYERWKSENGCRKGKYSYIYTKTEGENPLADIHAMLVPYRGNRIRIADLGDQFPETHITANAYDAGQYAPKIQKAYDDMLKEIARIEAAAPPNASASILVAILRARMQAEILKVPMMIDLAKDYQDAGYSVALFVSFTRTVYALADGLNTDCIIKGGMTQRQRDEAKRRFQADEVRAVVCNIKSGGVSLSLHDLNGKFPRAALINPTWSAFNLRQATFRVHRAGGLSKSIQRIVFAANTIEEKVLKKVQSKLECMDALNDGDLALTEQLYEGLK